MRCKSCDVVLNNTDLKRKDPNNGEHLDLCSKCFSYYIEAAREAPSMDFDDYVHGSTTSNVIFVPNSDY